MGQGQSQQRPTTSEPEMSPEERAQAQADVGYNNYTNICIY